MKKASALDANLVLQIYDIRREKKMRKAREWFMQSFKVSNMDEFNELCPMGSQENAYFRMVVSYWDMVASFLVRKALHRRLFYESGGEMIFVWARVEPLLKAFREIFQDPSVLRNYESAVKDYIKWKEKRCPGAWENIKARANA